MDAAEETNFQIFRECVATPLIENSTTTPAKTTRKPRAGRKTTTLPITSFNEETSDAEDLAEFIDYIAQEIFTSLPHDLRCLTYSNWLSNPSMQITYNNPLPSATASRIFDTLSPAICDSLTAYSILSPPLTTASFLLPILQTYISTKLTRPPPPSLTKHLATSCEICERSWIPLTFHHLIPRGVHAKVLKRGWHEEDQLENVAWLCRACHSFVHRVAPLEELAREWYTVERLCEREDVRSFAGWVGKIRWKAR